MDTRQFVEGYRTPANHVVAHHYETLDPEVQSVMEGPRKWASFFDRLLVLHLTGEQNGVNEPAAMFKELRDYQLGWLEPHLDSTLKTSYDLAERTLLSDSQVNELDFHILNREMMPAWYRLFYGGEVAELGPQRLQTMQTRLALRGADIQGKYQKYLLKEQRDGVRSDITHRISGQLNEIDTSIILLEIMKREGLSMPAHLIALPAPPQFEAGHKNTRRASDFLFFDSLTNQVRGIQVKGIVSSATEKEYDNEYVTLIDAVNDLGNSKSAYSPKRGHYTASAPGLIALDFLLNKTSISKMSRDPIFNTDMPTVFRAKESARSVFGTNKSYFDTAVNNVSGRILHDLYKQKASE